MCRIILCLRSCRRLQIHITANGKCSQTPFDKTIDFRIISRNDVESDEYPLDEIQRVGSSWCESDISKDGEWTDESPAERHRQVCVDGIAPVIAAEDIQDYCLRICKE